MKTLRDKVVVITGAGSGIGRALAILAASKGAKLALSDWNEEGLRETERRVNASGASRASVGLARRVDVRSEEETKSFAEEVARTLGGADVIVNNAGVAVSDTIGSMKRSDFEWLFDINFWGVVRGTEAFLPQLLTKDDAHVVNVSSIFGIIAVPSQSAYNASKFAVRGYTEALRQELDGTRVHVTCVHPGGVKTNIVANGRHHRNARGEPTGTDALAKEFAKVAMTTPESAAKTILGAVLSNAPRVLVGADAQMMDFVQRMFPSHYPSIFKAAQSLIARATGLRL